MTYHPGVGEIEWLASLAGRAERIGAEVFGRPIRWRVEVRLTRRRNRSDVRIEFDDGGIVATGEAKRPDDPHGATPLDPNEVDDAVDKAQHQGAPLCFTCNFHQLALLDAGPGMMRSPLTRLHGEVIEFVPRALARGVCWWANLTEAERDDATEAGLRLLFERIRGVTEGLTLRKALDSVVIETFSVLTGSLVPPLSVKFVTGGARTVAELRLQALLAGLDPDENRDCQYLVAQGVFEVLSAALFQQLLRDHFANLGPLLGGTRPRSPAALKRTVKAGLRDAQATSGDYESVLSMSPIAEWVLEEAPPAAVQFWVTLLSFVERLTLAQLSSDVLGSIFERLIAPDRRHEMGQHYTQPRLARSMATWGVTTPETRVLDPACGAGTFLVETYARHAALGLTHQQILAKTFGNDLDHFAVHLAAINLATRRIQHGLNHPLVRHGDAFELEPGIQMISLADQTLPEIDLVIANPPYKRNIEDATPALAHLHRLLDNDLPRTSGINLGAWFVLLGAGLLAPDGRMAFVLQSAVLQNENLTSWRQWVRKRWDVVVWHTEVDVWFSDARVATCVLLLSPRSEPGQGSGTLHFVDAREPATGELLEVSGVPSPTANAKVRDLSEIEPSDDWLIPGTISETLDAFSRLDRVARIGTIPDVVTGAGEKLGHKFFRLKDLDPEAPGIMRRVEGLGLQCRLHSSFLTPLLQSPKELTSGAPQLSGTWLLTLPEELPTTGDARRYVAHGRTREVNDAPSVAARGASWWHIEPSLWDIAVPMNGQFRHEVAYLAPRGAVSNNFNVVRCDDQRHARIIAASLASAFGALARLHMSGEVGCEGARRVLLSQFDQWPVLDPSAVSARHGERVIEAYERWQAFDVAEADQMEGDQLVAWTTLTERVAEAATGPGGMADARSHAAAAIREVREIVARRRLREEMALEGRTRATMGGGHATGITARVTTWVDTYPEYQRLLELLTSGPEVFRLRGAMEIDRLSFFAEHHPLAEVPETERGLSAVFWEGFEAAWPSPGSQLEQLHELQEVARRTFDRAVSSILGEAPVAESPARATWDDLADQVVVALRRRVQAEVRRTLSAQ